jgi:L-erythro-3,5-diaminohexanoate dehydrogenase
VGVAGAEPAAILCTQPHGTVLFFSMATSFQSAALFAEGIGSAVTLEIGNGYLEGHARETLELLRTCPALAARLV